MHKDFKHETWWIYWVTKVVIPWRLFWSKKADQLGLVSRTIGNSLMVTPAAFVGPAMLSVLRFWPWPAF